MKLRCRFLFSFVFSLWFLRHYREFLNLSVFFCLLLLSKSFFGAFHYSNIYGIFCCINFLSSFLLLLYRVVRYVACDHRKYVCNSNIASVRNLEAP